MLVDAIIAGGFDGDGAVGIGQHIIAALTLYQPRGFGLIRNNLRCVGELQVSNSSTHCRHHFLYFHGMTFE